MAFFLSPSQRPPAPTPPPHFLAINHQQTPANLALYTASESGDLSRIKTSLSSGAVINYFHKSNECTTALHNAARLKTGNASEVCRFLLESGARMDCKLSTNFNTPLHEAIQSGNTEVVQLFLDYAKDNDAYAEDADITNNDLFCKNSFGNTPMHLCIHKGDVDTSLLMMKFNHSCNVENNRGTSLLHSCAGLCSTDSDDIARNGNDAKYIKIAAHLLINNANPNAPDTNNYTPLHIAALRGNHQMIKLLLDSGSDPMLLTAKTHHRGGEKTALDIADGAGFGVCAHYLDDVEIKIESGENVVTNGLKVDYSK